MNVLLKRTYLFLIPLLLQFQSCGIYSFTGASTEGMKTVSVQFFENSAPLVVPGLSQQFTEALKERIRNQSSLSITRDNGDGNFEGRITDYSIRPVAVTGNEIAEATRISITVQVKYVNSVDDENSFEQSFTRFKELPGSNVQAQEQSAIREINQLLTEDIFNKAFANW
ncbi:lipopolysaccharide assembly protein [Arcticibacter pallidicorallinus]|uniref:Lipopolysaccharide assembly protein n=1 Tax=Arcticibacter pallidicorallinus TaxID=1259464 RepID=A0A2T0U8M7_9SPHI|nr:LptE family protein [Arcticibacter pallidicorallinus]PRY54280.1 lipopolysaccharide assembly protein [Arcticibacter pallidicorallinus]